MRVRVLFFSQLRERFGAQQDADVTDGASVGDVVRRYSLSDLPLRFAVNEEFVEPDTVLQNEDTLAFLMPVSGGA